MQVNLTKIILYVVLTVLAIYCGRQFIARYSLLMTSDVNADPLALIEPPTEAVLPPVDPAGTNEVEGATGETPPADGQGEAVPGEGEAAPIVEAETNQVGEAATEVPEVVPVAEPPAPEPQMMTKLELERGRGPDTSGIGLYAFALFGVLIGLGFLIAHDVSTLLGQKTHKLLHNDEGEGIHSVAYDQAEDVWASGDYLEAIRLMREYLNNNPREVHVMARIAEIYEKDLGNHLAAALEYEEFLKQKLPAERWGWAAIHLVNLYYGKLDKPTQGLALLWRIHREYGQAQAAAKARKRLQQIDPDFAVEQARLDREAAEAAAGGGDEEEITDPAPAAPSYAPEPAAPAWDEPVEDPQSNLPKGFRPKKR
jgi:hypothetical protein